MSVTSTTRRVSVIGKMIKAYRTMFNITLKDFIKISKISKSTLLKVEAGEIEIKTLYSLKKVATAMQIEFTDFVLMYEELGKVEESKINLTIYNKLSDYYLSHGILIPYKQ